MIKRIEDLQINGYRIYQSEECFCFGQDSVLLANYVVRQYKKKFDTKNKNKINTKICDLCSGTAIIPLLLHAKLLDREVNIENNVEAKKYDEEQCLDIVAIEIEKEVANLARESLELNSQVFCDKNIKILNEDIKNIFLKKELYSKMYHSFDIVTANPPYIKLSAGVKNEKEKFLIARAELKCVFDDVCNAASKLLQTKGSFFIIHKTQRLPELIITMKKYKLEPKYIKFIHTNSNSVSQNFLLEAVKEAGEELIVQEPHIVKN